jgi:hypothetical protein
MDMIEQTDEEWCREESHDHAYEAETDDISQVCRALKYADHR